MNDYAKDDPFIHYGLNIGGIFQGAMLFPLLARDRDVFARGKRYGLRHGFTYFMPAAKAALLGAETVITG